MTIKGMTQSLRWLGDVLALFQTEAIKIPGKYREQVTATKKLLKTDTSGLINTLLNFSISAASVDYSIETNNANLTESLNKWLSEINSDYRGKIPTGIDALAKEYFRERWKGSSNLVLRTFWKKKDDLDLPTTMFFVDGEDVVTERKNPKVVTLGDEKYFIRIDNNRENNIPIPQSKDELLFVQRPYESWGTIYPVPFLIRKGLFRNLMFLTIMSQKGEYIISRALEYLFLIKKGTEKMTMEGRADLTYSPDDLKKITSEFSALLDDKKSQAGTPTYATNFDTELQHMIPDYKLAVNETIYAPVERKILAGLGMIDIVTGTSTNRREAMLNPKPLIAEVTQGIEDFRMLINDLLQTIKERNKSHKKYFGDKSVKTQVYSGPVEHFVDDKVRDHIRSMYDRGTVSIQTYNNVVGVGYIDHEVEVKRRKLESDKKLEDLMYPHLIDNREGQGMKDVPGVKLVKTTDKPTGKKPVEENPDAPKNPKDVKAPDKTGPEKKNYKSELEEAKIIGEPVDPRRVDFSEYEESVIVKTKKGWNVKSKDGKNLGGPYKTKKEATKRLKQVEYYKNKIELEEDLDDMDMTALIELKKLEIMGKQNKILDMILEEDRNETSQ